MSYKNQYTITVAVEGGEVLRTFSDIWVTDSDLTPILIEDMRSAIDDYEKDCYGTDENEEHDEADLFERINELIANGLDAQEIFEALIMEGIYDVSLEYITALRTEAG